MTLRLFTETLYTLSTIGMSDEQQRHIVDWQMSQIGNWKNTLVAAERLGTFYHRWGQLVDPSSQLHKGGKFSDILLEVDNPDDPTSKITPSTMIRHIEEATIIGAEKKDVSQSGGFTLTRNWSQPRQANKTEKEPIELNFGTRIADNIMAEVRRTTLQQGKTNLYTQIMEDANEAGLVGNPPPLASLLNVDPSKIMGSSAQAKRTQSNIAALLRSNFPDLQLSEKDEEILPLRFVQASLEQLLKAPITQPASPFITILQVPNTDLDTVQEKLFTEVAADNKAPDEKLEAAKKRFPADSLVSNNVLLHSLTIPVAGKANLFALWNKAITKGAFIRDEASAIGQAQSNSGVAITSVLLKKADQPVYSKMHILRNDKLKRTMIVGEETISDDLYNRLKRNNIIYISQGHESTTNTITAELQLILEPKLESEVVKAFFKRNKPISSATTSSLVQLLSGEQQSELLEPNFITNLAPDKVPHSQKVLDDKA